MKYEMISRRLAARNQLEGYVRSRVLPALGMKSVEFEIHVPSDGTRSIVLFLIAGGQRYVMKCFSDLMLASRTAWSSRHVARRGAPVPKLLYQDLSPVTRFRFGYYILVEEAIEGRNLYEIEAGEREIRSAAHALALLHSVRREQWGGILPGLGRRGNYFGYQSPRLNRRLDDLVRILPELEAFGHTDIREWFAGQDASGIQRGGYSLCHMRVTATNILIGESGKATLIDLVTARYAHHALDLERALYRWCRYDPELSEVLLDEYFRTAPALDREAWLVARPFYRASFHLTQIYHAAKEFIGFRKTGRRDKIRHRRRVMKRHIPLLIDAIRSGCVPPSEAVLDSVLSSAREGMQELRPHGMGSRLGLGDSLRTRSS